MSHRTQLALVLAAALLSGGCGTINNVKKPCVAYTDQPSAPVCRVYGGVRNDWDVFWRYPWNKTTPYVDYVFIPLLAVIEISLDVFGDTLTLPYTVAEAGRREFGNPTPSLSYVPLPVRANTAPAAPSGAAPQPGGAPLPAPRPAPAPAPSGAPPLPAIPPVPKVPEVTSPR